MSQPKAYKGGFDPGLLSTALATGNQTRQRNAQEDAEQAEKPAGRASRRGNADKGKLFSFGNGDSGRLGHGDNTMHKTPKLVEILRDRDIVNFACGHRHTLALSSDGKVWSWGYGNDGQLGLGDYQLQTMPQQIKHLDRENVIAIAAGDKHSVALTSGGEIYAWGDGTLGQLGLGDFAKQCTPYRVTELVDKMVLRIACGAFHTAAIVEGTTRGSTSVYTWGQGGDGRLGHDHENNLATPTLVFSLEGKNIQTIQCFGEHTIAMTVPEGGAGAATFDASSQERLLQQKKELEFALQRVQLSADEATEKLNAGRSQYVESEQNAIRLKKEVDALLAERVDLYMKMQSLESQLAISASDRSNLDKQLRSLVNIPTKLEEIASQGVRQIACGQAHILVLSDSGDVYAWGSGGSGQLGLGKRNTYPSPQLVWGMMRKGVRQIAAGDVHSLALTYNGQVYSWGSSKVGQLGHKDRKTRSLPKLVQALEDESREQSSTVRLIGAGSRHSVAVMGNGQLYLWGRPDFGKLGRSKMDAYNEPVRIDALWRREVSEGHTDRTRALGKQEITELLDQQLNVHDIERYFPDIQSDPEAALFLAKAVAMDLQERVNDLQNNLEKAREESKLQLETYVANQEKAFLEKEKRGLENLQLLRKKLDGDVDALQKKLFTQKQVEERLQEELDRLNDQIGRDELDKQEALDQARRDEKSDLEKILKQALNGLRQAKKDKEVELVTARKQVQHAQEELEYAQQQLSVTRVDIKKHEKLGYKKSIEQTNMLITQISALSQRLAETAIEHIEPSMQNNLTSTVGLRDLLAVSDSDIDRIMAQAAAFCSDDHVDVTVRQQLATLLFDNAEMRKQLNAYIGGILSQTMEKLDGGIFGGSDTRKFLGVIGGAQAKATGATGVTAGGAPSAAVDQAF
mmetsp:Transcript_58175/g.115467  ORF Transcript_58175/g.115467 Transcript_58175/m.115467 type:complete len:913 (-) Transcript_58175:296-3034(-)|eukprot:CAMPEP_0174722366 /NCGR_PEP_ID=MMETSP1094-20130205/38283_1 /TAXON_ID=156173 /ORGANISM="Chrysochromulina brevifilum, Strain UTEX LB 985" /LENGTH=912 /DNA_ID=CAMNT_0015923215 /DNA_START=39 /DNA_END=2777 /DNA_ORIENTATION=+